MRPSWRFSTTTSCRARTGPSSLRRTWRSFRSTQPGARAASAFRWTRTGRRPTPSATSEVWSRPGSPPPISPTDEMRCSLPAASTSGSRARTARTPSWRYGCTAGVSWSCAARGSSRTPSAALAGTPRWRASVATRTTCSSRGCTGPGGAATPSPRPDGCGAMPRSRPPAPGRSSRRPPVAGAWRRRLPPDPRSASPSSRWRASHRDPGRHPRWAP